MYKAVWDMQLVKQQISRTQNTKAGFVSLQLPGAESCNSIVYSEESAQGLHHTALSTQRHPISCRDSVFRKDVTR